MKISGKNNGPSTHGSSGAAASAESSRTAKAGALEAALDAGDTDKAAKTRGGHTVTELSTRAQEMAKAKELATPKGDIDEAKVARLQKMIDDGKYKVDAEAIADRMLDEHTKMS